MIFISLGTTLIPFPRLIESSLEILSNTRQEIHIQHGNTPVESQSKSIITTPYISNSEMIEEIRNANMIICAAGEATVFQILQNARYKPILFPRLKKFHEHVDDQQLSIAQYFEKKDKAYCALDSEQLQQIMNEYPVLEKNNHLRKETNKKIIDKLIRFTENL
ncbi:MAG: glycosyltransferase [Patescibacteria group bacterium]